MIELFLTFFVPLLIIVNPSSTLALFSTITGSYSKKERITTARHAVFYATILLVIFAIAGSTILEYLQIDVYSLRIAGGILLSYVGLDMVRRGKEFGETISGETEKVDYALVPLAMPSLSGPGAITLTIVGMRNMRIDHPWWIAISIAFISILLTMIITYGIFLSSGIIIKILGKKGMDAFTRVMGLLTVAIAVQFALTGLAQWIQIIWT